MGNGYTMIDKHPITRFWNKVDVRGPDECWLWTATTNPKGYGMFYYRLTTNETSGAHRVSYFLAHGVIPNVCRHTCDNPPCVNPAHLLDGTGGDNTADMVKRGRAKNRNTSKKGRWTMTTWTVGEFVTTTPDSTWDNKTTVLADKSQRVAEPDWQKIATQLYRAIDHCYAYPQLKLMLNIEGEITAYESAIKHEETK